MVYPYLAPCLSEENQYSGGDFRPHGPGLAVSETAAVYIPRNPEESILYDVVAAQLEAFLERQHCRDRINRGRSPISHLPCMPCIPIAYHNR